MPIDPNPKYKKFREKRYAAGRGTEGAVGFDRRDQYSPGSAPRVGGTAKKSTPLVGANRNQMRTASKLRRRMGTGSGASRAARRSRNRLYNSQQSR